MRNKVIKKITNKPFGCGQGYTQESKFTIPFWNIDFEDEDGYIDNTFVSCEFLYDFFGATCTIEEFELKLKAGKINYSYERILYSNVLYVDRVKCFIHYNLDDY